MSGVSLIEVLVAILIFSFGLLGLVGLQARALEFSTSAEDTSRAALLANEMATTLVTFNSLTPSEDQLASWQERIADATRGGLPSSEGTVEVDANVATVTIQWTPPSSADSAFNSRNTYVTQVVLP